MHLTDEGVEYNGISAKKIIFCDGISSTANPWFSLLPFSANKGEALIIAVRICPRTIFTNGAW
jgi:hypothetical protein